MTQHPSAARARIRSDTSGCAKMTSKAALLVPEADREESVAEAPSGAAQAIPDANMAEATHQSACGKIRFIRNLLVVRKRRACAQEMPAGNAATYAGAIWSWAAGKLES